MSIPGELPSPIKRCATCGFDLTDLPPGVCPQCGTEFAAGEKLARVRGTTATDDTAWHCLSCNYKLTGLTHDRCPECGEPVDWYAMGKATEHSTRLTPGMKRRLFLPGLLVAGAAFANVLTQHWMPSLSGLASGVTIVCGIVAIAMAFYVSAQVALVFERRLSGRRGHQPVTLASWLLVGLFNLLTLLFTFAVAVACVYLTEVALWATGVW